MAAPLRTEGISIDPDPVMAGRTASVGKSQGLGELLRFPGLYIVMLILGFAPGTLIAQLLVFHDRSLWHFFLGGGIGAAVVWAILLLVYTSRAPYSIATVSPRGIRLRWGPKARFVPWASVRAIHRVGTALGAVSKDQVGLWRLSYGPQEDGVRTLLVTDAPALAMLLYPSCPRLPLTPSELRILQFPGDAPAPRRGNPVASEWVQPRGLLWQRTGQLGLILVVAALLLDVAGLLPSMLALALVVPALVLGVASFVGRVHARGLGPIFPRSIDIGSEGVTAFFVIGKNEDGSPKQASRAMRYESVTDLVPGTGFSFVGAPSTPAALIGKFQPGQDDQDMKVFPLPHDLAKLSRESPDILYLARENYEPVKAAWEKWKVAAATSGEGLNTVAAGAWMATSDIHRFGPVRLPPPPRG